MAVALSPLGAAQSRLLGERLRDEGAVEVGTVLVDAQRRPKATCLAETMVLCEPRRFLVGETSPGLGQPVGPQEPAYARLDPGGLSGAGRGLGAAQGEPVVVANAIHIHRARGESQELVGLVE